MNSSSIKTDNAKGKNNKITDDKNSTFGLSGHKPAYDAPSLNRAVERAIKDEGFLNTALEAIKPV
jgi:hypothetical protein